MRNPSPELLQRLAQLDLCEPSAVRACRPEVRRLARDIPAFDSVWVDALVQRRSLTPFQADILLSEHPARLNAGPCVLLDRLGAHDSWHTFLARRRGGSDKCVLRFVRPPAETFERVEASLVALAEALCQVSSQAVAGPHASIEYEDRLVGISRFVEGIGAREALVQAGRFSAEDVIEIGTQLVHGLAKMEPHWPTHGDIRLANLRISADGAACLVNCGMAPATEQRFVVHHRLRADRCDTVAPELIGCDRAPDARSDLYSLGCLLWQLLCGRPPFPTGDPLEKLAAHQTRVIADVRTIAPDTPAWLAEIITVLTSSVPADRPASFVDAAAMWQQRGPRTPLPPDIRRYSQRVRGIAIRSRTQRRPANAVAAVVALLALTGIGFAVSGSLSGTRLLDVTSESSDTGSGRSNAPSETQLYALPRPDADGRIHLTHPGPWRASELKASGALSITGPEDQPAQIILADPTWNLTADQLELANLTITTPVDRLPTAGESPQALITCVSRSLRINGCQFTSDTTNDGLAWSSTDRRDHSAGRVVITDSQFVGCRRALLLIDAPRDLNLGNVLIATGQNAVDLPTPVPAGHRLTSRWVNVTVRDVDHVIQTRLTDDGDVGHIDVLLADSVFGVRSSGAAFAIAAAALPPYRSRAVLQTGSRRDADASLLSDSAARAVWINPLTGVESPLPDGLVFADDLINSPLTFRGPADSRAANSYLTTFQAPRRSAAMPGIHATGSARTVSRP